MKKVTIFALSTALLLLAGCSQQSSDTPASSTTNSVANSTVVSSESASSSAADTATSTKLPSVTVEEAIQIFQDKVKDGAITSLELDTSFGNFFYKIEGVDDANEYEMKIDAETKEVSEERQEALDADEQNGVKKQEDQLDLSNMMSLEKISEIAVNKVGAGQATDWDLDKELNVTFWEVKVENGNTKTNVKINAQTGEILETEIDD